MKKGGNLDAHNHKEGWLSGSFYLRLPTASQSNSDEGKLMCTVQGPRYPTKNQTFAKRVMDIKERDICLFPSSLFHATIPFDSEQERISFAFDVKPLV